MQNEQITPALEEVQAPRKIRIPGRELGMAVPTNLAWTANFDSKVQKSIAVLFLRKTYRSLASGKSKVAHSGFVSSLT